MTTQHTQKVQSDDLLDAEAEHKAMRYKDQRRDVNKPNNAYARIIDIADNTEDYINFRVVLDTGSTDNLVVYDLDKFKSALNIKSLDRAAEIDIPVTLSDSGCYTVAYNNLCSFIDNQIISLSQTIFMGSFISLFIPYIPIAALVGPSLSLLIVSVLMMNIIGIWSEYRHHIKYNVAPWDGIEF